MPGDIARRTRHIGGILFLLTAAFMLAKTGRDALYFQGEGPATARGDAFTRMPDS